MRKRLNESYLQRVIKESMSDVLNEDFASNAAAWQAAPNTVGGQPTGWMNGNPIGGYSTDANGTVRAMDPNLLANFKMEIGQRIQQIQSMVAQMQQRIKNGQARIAQRRQTYANRQKTAQPAQARQAQPAQQTQQAQPQQQMAKPVANNTQAAGGNAAAPQK